MGSILSGHDRLMVLFLAQDGRCAGCGGLVARKFRLHPDPLSPTFDHVQPRSQGGSSGLDNGLLKHRRCNLNRGAAPPTGCDHIWHQLVLARMPTFKRSIRVAAMKEKQLKAYRERVDAARIVEGHDGASYRLWGFVRLAGDGGSVEHERPSPTEPV